MDKKIVFSVDELSDYLHVSKSSIRKMVRTKEIPFFRILSIIFFDKEIIDIWIKNQQISNLNSEKLRMLVEESEMNNLC